MLLTVGALAAALLPRRTEPQVKTLPSVESLINDLTNSDIRVKERAVMGLGVRGPEAKKAVPELIKMLDSKNCYGFNSDLVETLTKILPETCIPLNVLLQGLWDTRNEQKEADLVRYIKEIAEAYYKHVS